MPTPLPPPPEPIRPATRERIAERLARHFSQDDLTEAQLELRLQRVYAAATESELEAIVADLPALVATESPPPRPEKPAAAEVTALLSGQEQMLAGVLPRELRVRARLGYVELDLTQASFEPGVTTIDVRAFMGYVQVRLPTGVRVESRGRALLGFFSCKGVGAPGREEPADARSIVRLTGRAALGFAEGTVSGS